MAGKKATKAKKAAIFEKDCHQTFWSFLFCLGFTWSKICFLISGRLLSITVLSTAAAAWRRRDDRINTYTLNFSMKNDPCGISNDYLASLKLELPSAVWTAEPCLDYVFSQDPKRTEDRLTMKCPLDFSDPMLNHVTYLVNLTLCT